MELWFTEKHTPAAGLTLRCRRTLFSKRSKIQQIDVLDTEEFGRMLLLDGLVMTTERDEFIYHEMLVHPAMHTGRKPPCQVLVIGGGDGGAVRELMKYPCLGNIVLCEIDPMVVEVSRRFLPEISPALSDSDRLEIVFRDGAVYAGEHKNRFDRIFIDSSDPAGAAEVLFTARFYRKCLESLTEDGVLVVQSESPIYHLPIIRQIKEGLLEAGFAGVRFYTAPIPTYPGGFWSWAVAAGRPDNLAFSSSFLPEAEMELLKFFTPEMLSSCFVLPAFMKRELAGAVQK